MHFNRGSLPWQALKANSKKEKYEQIMEMKMAIPIEVLCEHFPPEFAAYLNYCRSLRFEDISDYAYLRRLLKDLFFRQGYEYDNIFDWSIIIISRRATIVDQVHQMYQRHCRAQTLTLTITLPSPHRWDHGAGSE